MLFLNDRFRFRFFLLPFALAIFASFSICARVNAQSLSGSIQGTVTDPSKAVVPGAAVQIQNPVSGYSRETTTDSNGVFQFTNIPFNPYHLTVTSPGFNASAQDADVRSSIPVKLQIGMALAGASTSITVESDAADLIETTSTFHTDVDRALFETVPLESQSSSVSSLVTLVSPGVSADSNGLFHGLGDHAENSFSVDGQPITDQQSKVFSNQIPADAIQSMEVIPGAPPAEYGDKTSLIIDVTTRSGLGQTKPTGSVTTSYGSFGSVSSAVNVGFGGMKWGDFLSANGLNTGRFLDPPEFVVYHDKGNQENLFDRLDIQPNGSDSLHLNFSYTRSWFQTPNSFDAQYHLCDAEVDTCNSNNTLVVNPATGVPLGPSDQRSQIKTYNIAPSWGHLFGSATSLNLGGWVRHDQYNYYASANPFADYTTLLQGVTAAQDRTLTNAGARADVSYVRGKHNAKVGVTFQHTLITENDTVGVVDPVFLGPGSCPDPTNPLCPYDLTQGGSLFPFRGHGDIKQVALYAQDAIALGNWSFNVGLRGDFYRGFTSATQPEPRAGLAYNIKRSNTVLRVSYARVMETPFNENLAVTSLGDSSGMIAATLGAPATIPPGSRNEFHAGFQQALGKYLVVNADYIWKFTHNSYDFSVLYNTPITLPIAWHNSKIYGPVANIRMPNFHGLSAFLNVSSINARFFCPQAGGVDLGVGNCPVFRIDHDEKFNQTTHILYQPRQNWPFIGFNWRYDSGQVAGAVPCYSQDPNSGCFGFSSLVAGVPTVDLTNLSPNQEFQSGIMCNGVAATQTVGFSSCPANQYTATRVSIPAPNTESDDKNPPRIAPRSLFDLEAGEDNLFRTDRYKWSLHFTVVNLTNKVALYNFLSTFSGTHFVTPRAYTAQLGFHF
jgi:hypothetical protein